MGERVPKRPARSSGRVRLRQPVSALAAASRRVSQADPSAHRQRPRTPPWPSSAAADGAVQPPVYRADELILTAFQGEGMRSVRQRRLGDAAAAAPKVLRMDLLS